MKRFKSAVPVEGVLMLRLDASFSFVNADFVRDLIFRECKDDPKIHSVVLDASGINDLDTTAASVLGTISKTLRGRGIELYLTGVKGRVRDTVARTDLVPTIGTDRFFLVPYLAMEHIERRLKDQTED